MKNSHDSPDDGVKTGTKLWKSFWQSLYFCFCFVEILAIIFFVICKSGLHTDSIVPVKQMEVVRFCLLGPWLLSKLPPPQPSPQERCGYQSCRSNTKPSHVQILFSPSSESKTMRGTCYRTLNHPPKLYISPMEEIIWVRELFSHLSHLFLKLLQLGRVLLSQSLWLHLRLYHTPQWIVHSWPLGPAQLDTRQSGLSYGVTWKVWQRLPLPSLTCFPSLDSLHQACPEISMESLWCSGPQFLRTF